MSLWLSRRLAYESTLLYKKEVISRLSNHISLVSSFSILQTFGPEHLVPNTFSPRTFGPPQLVPKNKQSRLIWSPRQLVLLDIGSQNLLVLSKSSLEHFFQFFDIWWPTFGITDYFKPIFKMFFFHFGEIKQSLFFLFFSNIIFF